MLVQLQVTHPHTANNHPQTTLALNTLPKYPIKNTGTHPTPRTRQKVVARTHLTIQPYRKTKRMESTLVLA